MAASYGRKVDGGQGEEHVVRYEDGARVTGMLCMFGWRRKVRERGWRGRLKLRGNIRGDQKESTFLGEDVGVGHIELLGGTRRMVRMYRVGRLRVRYNTAEGPAAWDESVCGVWGRVISAGWNVAIHKGKGAGAISETRCCAGAVEREERLISRTVRGE